MTNPARTDSATRTSPKLRDLLPADRPLWGAFLGSNSPICAELMSKAGFDWLVVDTQHAPSGGPEQLSAMLRATGEVPTLVRIPWKSDLGAAMTALDAGAQGLIVPMLDTAEEAALIAGACRYPPRGFRSFGPWRAALQVDDYRTEDGDDTVLCFVQIETKSGIDNLDAIVDAPGVDGAYIGPQDLSLSHDGGLSWRTDNRVLHELCERVLKACRRAGKLAVAHTADPDDAVHWGEVGFDLVTATSDTRLMGVAAAEAITTLRADLSGRTE
jgi:4-hydroxy-2-oxoheptanedioate aldolase